MGTALLAHVLATAVELDTHAAARAVVVNAINPNARRWSERLGFQPLDPDEEECPDLYLLSTEIAKTFDRDP